MVRNLAALADSRLSEIYISAESKQGGTVPIHAQTQPMSSSYIMAKSLFDCNEYARCSAWLARTSSNDPTSLFLELFSAYLAAEKNKEEDSETVLGPKDTKLVNQELTLLSKRLELVLSHTRDSYLLYLYGMFKRQLHEEDQAIEALIAAVNLEPWNWSAWQELTLMMSSPTTINRVMHQISSDHITKTIFNVATLLELHLSGDEITQQLDSLDLALPNNLFLKSQRAILAYNAQDFEQAETIFDEIIQRDPHRLDYIDVYSNILFVLERRAKLSHLAKSVSATDKFRPETCCVIGNYYSLSSDHESAVKYFKKALKLNKSYLAAWTLMGHEYVELKNTHAAIESYRRAVDINNKDYRAWYGLGQAYEMLEMHYYALHYFQRAAALKPFDVRMWAAVGNCHEKLGRLGESIKAFKRALLGDGALDLLHLMKLGDLYERSGQSELAYTQFQACVDASRTDDSVDVSRAVLWIQRYEASND